MHNIDIDIVDMALDVLKFAINRITDADPMLGFPSKEAELRKLVGDTVTPTGIGGEKAFELFRDVLLPSSISINHPRHLAFVSGSPTRAAIMFDLVTSASSIHGAFWMEGAGGIFAENQAMEWLVELTGLPAGAFGVFTSGGTEANLSALVAAREYWRGLDVANQHKRGLIITSKGSHSSIFSTASVMDVDVIFVECEDKFGGTHLEQALTDMSAEDRSRAFAVVATGGTTNAGIIDELESVAKVCERERLWMHVDAAYGGAALAVPAVRPLFNGIERADSVTIDPHKWLFAPYDCGAVIYRDMETARKAHTQEGSYLDAFHGQETSGFNPSDYQIQLTRRLRGLPLWFSLAMHGTDRYVKAISRGLELAELAGRIITDHEGVELVREPALSCVLFRRIGWSAKDYEDWMYRNHKAGFALVAPTKWCGETVARFCFINPDTTEEDIRNILATMDEPATLFNGDGAVVSDLRGVRSEVGG